MSFQYTITYQVTTPESAEAGDFEKIGWEVEEPIVCRTLKELANEVKGYGWIYWSGSPAQPGDWLISTHREDRAYFEKGEERTFGLHVQRHGGKLTPGDIRELSSLLGIRR